MIIAASCLAIALFFEARDQPVDGQMAVAEVILNRVADPRWPDNVCDVITQHRQFSFYHDGLSDDPTKYYEPKAWITAQIIAHDAIHGWNLTGIPSTWYHARGLNRVWTHGLTVDGTIGDHIFYSD